MQMPREKPGKGEVDFLAPLFKEVAKKSSGGRYTNGRPIPGAGD